MDGSLLPLLILLVAVVALVATVFWARRRSGRRGD